MKLTPLRAPAATVEGSAAPLVPGFLPELVPPLNISEQDCVPTEGLSLHTWCVCVDVFVCDSGCVHRWMCVCKGLGVPVGPSVLTQRVSWAQGLGGHAAVHRKVEWLLHFGPDDSVRKTRKALSREGNRAPGCPRSICSSFIFSILSLFGRWRLYPSLGSYEK